MDLYVVRHAVAERRDRSRWPDDRDRPLTSSGENRFRRTARGLKAIAAPPDRVFSSPLARAWRTAEILSQEAGWPQPEAWETLEPDCPPEKISEALGPHAGAAALAVVGHEPNLSELASHLLTGDPDAAAIRLRKGGVICLDAGGFPEPGSAMFLWMATPRILRSLS